MNFRELFPNSIYKDIKLDYRPEPDSLLQRYTDEAMKYVFTIYPIDMKILGYLNIVEYKYLFGNDDMRLGKDNNLPFIQHVAMNGRFSDSVVDFAGLEVKV